MRWKIDSFLDEDEGIYSKRELARKIGEHPSSVYRVLQRCIEGDDLDPPTVVRIRGMGYCHKNYEAGHRKRRSRLPAFRQVIREEGATTRSEDETALMIKEHHGKAGRILGKNPVGWLYRRFIRGAHGFEDPESTFDTFLDWLARVRYKGEEREKIERGIRRGRQAYERWRQKPP